MLNYHRPQHSHRAIKNYNFQICDPTKARLCYALFHFRLLSTICYANPSQDHFLGKYLCRKSVLLQLTQKPNSIGVKTSMLCYANFTITPNFLTTVSYRRHFLNCKLNSSIAGDIKSVKFERPIHEMVMFAQFPLHHYLHIRLLK